MVLAVKEQVLELIEKLQASYSVNGDLEGIKELFTKSGSVVGIGLERLNVESDQPKPSLSIKPLANGSALVYGWLTDDACGREDEWQSRCFSAICAPDAHEMKLEHLQVGPAMVGQAEKWFRGIFMREREMAALGRNIPGGAHCCRSDEGLTILYVSESFLTLTGYSREEIKQLFHDSYLEMIYREDRERIVAQMAAQLVENNMVVLEYRIRRQDGQVIWLLDRGQLVKENGEALFYSVMVDVTEQNKQREELRLSLERHQVIMDQVSDIIFEWDIMADTLTYSDNWRKNFGYDGIAIDISNRIPLSSNIHQEDMAAFVRIMEDTAEGVPYSETEFRIRDIQGNYWWNRIRATTQYADNGQPIKAIGVISNIDEEKNQRQQLIEQAQRDPLTRVFNKSTIQSMIDDWLGSQQCATGALLLLDLDDFKRINDTQGHLFGDVLLANLADVLRRNLPPEGMLGRIGGDEFLIFLPELGKDDVESMVQQLMKVLKERITVDGVNSISCSIGGAFYPEDGRDFVSLYRLADKALYHVKNNKKGEYIAYDVRFQADSSEEMARMVVNTVIDSDAPGVDLQLSQYCFRMLYDAMDVKTAVNTILEIVGRSYGVSRTYIFENSVDNRYCSNTFEWCAQGIPAEMGQRQALCYETDLAGYMECFNEQGIFYYPDAHDLPENLYALLNLQSVRSILQCGIWDDGVFRGYVGFDDCQEYRIWNQSEINSLKLIANVLSTFLLKERLKERIKLLEATR